MLHNKKAVADRHANAKSQQPTSAACMQALAGNLWGLRDPARYDVQLRIRQAFGHLVMLATCCTFTHAGVDSTQDSSHNGVAFLV
jgi:hypothetical protein